MIPKFPECFFTVPDPNTGVVTDGKTVLAGFRMVDEFKKVEGFLTEHTMLFVLKGSKHIHFPDRDIPLVAGDLLLMKRGVYFMSNFVAEEGVYNAIMLCLNDQFLKSFMQQYTDTKSVHSSLLYKPVHIHCTDELLTLRSSIEYYIYHQHVNTPKLIRLKMQELLLLLLSGPYKDKVMDYLLHLFDTSEQTISYTIKANLFKPFSVEDYAKLCGLSLTSFKREFAKIFTSSPREWINAERLKHAHFLLQSGDANVNEVALECGFDNVSYFIKLYKAKYGHTPKQSILQPVLRAEKQ